MITEGPMWSDYDTDREEKREAGRMYFFGASANANHGEPGGVIVENEFGEDLEEEEDWMWKEGEWWKPERENWWNRVSDFQDEETSRGSP